MAPNTSLVNPTLSPFDFGTGRSVQDAPLVQVNQALAGAWRIADYRNGSATCNPSGQTGGVVFTGSAAPGTWDLTPGEILEVPLLWNLDIVNWQVGLRIRVGDGDTATVTVRLYGGSDVSDFLTTWTLADTGVLVANVDGYNIRSDQLLPPVSNTPRQKIEIEFAADTNHADTYLAYWQVYGLVRADEDIPDPDWTPSP